MVLLIFESWKYDNGLPDSFKLPVTHGNQTLNDLPNNFKFPANEFFKQQHQKTEDLALRHSHLTDLISYWSTHYGGCPHPERTLKAEILCEWEALSRRAKVLWAVHNGHDVISLQHDGIVAALREDASIHEATTELQRASAKGTSYDIPVSNKPMVVEGVQDSRPRIYAQGRPINISSYKNIL